MRLIFLHFFLILNLLAVAQNKENIVLIDSLKTGNNCPDCKPVVYATENDDYPFLVKFTGEILAVTPAAVPCDAICNSGTIAVRIISKEPTPPFNYPHDTIYISIPCFYVNAEDYIGKIVKMTVFKMENFPNDCFQNITNKIESKGVPFYYTSILKEELIELEAFIQVYKKGNEMLARMLKSTFCQKFDELAIQQAKWKFINCGYKDSTFTISLLVKKESITPDCYGFQKIPQVLEYKDSLEIRIINTTRGGTGREKKYYKEFINDYLEVFFTDTVALFNITQFDSAKIGQDIKERWTHIQLFFNSNYKDKVFNITDSLKGKKLGLFVKGKFITYSVIKKPVQRGVIQFEIRDPEVAEGIIKEIAPTLKIRKSSVQIK